MTTDDVPITAEQAKLINDTLVSSADNRDCSQTIQMQKPVTWTRQR